MKKLLYIVGPTASGKTALAMNLSQTISSTIISADSVQVYKGLDIISGKDIPSHTQFVLDKDFKDISSEFNIGYFLINSTPLYLLDIVESSYSFSISDYQKIALPVIESALRQKRLPIVAGGSGFYIRTLLDPIETIDVPQNASLRDELEREDVEILQKKLQTLNTEKYTTMNESDKYNKRRLIRSIEVARYKESHTDISPIENSLENYEWLIIGLSVEREILKNMIDMRVGERIEQGAFEEAEHLFKNYHYLSNQVKTANGYKQLFDYFSGKVTKDEAMLLWKRSEYYNAKKQMTWFSKRNDIIWFDATKKNIHRMIKEYVIKWYNQK
jgi:tRNA dimethylallyltransferase